MNTASFWTRLVATVLRRPLPPLQPPHPQLTLALLHQAQHLQSLHQLQHLRHLAACWLAVPDQRRLDLALQQRLVEMQQQQTNRQRSRRSTSSRKQTARSTTKRRR